MARDVERHSYNRGDALLSYRKGIELYDRGDTPGALKRFRAAAASSPDFADARLWIARILFEQGRFAESIPEWQTAIDICSGNSHAAFYLDLAQQKVAAELTMK
jgi:tetratricopeptide (TPR) repeat protein